MSSVPKPEVSTLFEEVRNNGADSNEAVKTPPFPPPSPGRFRGSGFLDGTRRPCTELQSTGSADMLTLVVKGSKSTPECHISFDTKIQHLRSDDFPFPCFEWNIKTNEVAFVPSEADVEAWREDVGRSGDDYILTTLRELAKDFLCFDECTCRQQELLELIVAWKTGDAGM
eukprot:TRINITY_DN3622_c0_g1_i1.p1 TRINITY_DN3622_c0_g1~~TRINITY_DN3622_c0_g1_i1.p1  ORF type:complete len:171 (+),score=29.13 TRINITY_DN3622_c0_g1_i1:64-576(+)